MLSFCARAMILLTVAVVIVSALLIVSAVGIVGLIFGGV